jgi:hypothetical protein
MNSSLSVARSSRRTRPAAPAASRPLPHVAWIHDGLRYRATIDPELRFEREAAPGEWVAAELGDDVFASTTLGISGPQWRAFLEYLPSTMREFVRGFSFSQMAALHVIARCPALLGELQRTPALTPFLAAHLALRGGDAPAWSEIDAVFGREGIYGLLQWLGLPASPQTLAILQAIADPDLPRRLLEPLRAALWDPEAIWMLSRTPSLTDERLVAACHALAA